MQAAKFLFIFLHFFFTRTSPSGVRSSIVSRERGQYWDVKCMCVCVCVFYGSFFGLHLSHSRTKTKKKSSIGPYCLTRLWLIVCERDAHQCRNSRIFFFIFWVSSHSPCPSAFIFSRVNVIVWIHTYTQRLNDYWCLLTKKKKKIKA